jgi:glucose-1-phosphate cytidylyltransferase
MVQIGERPVLWHIMKIFASYGYKDFVLALGYKGDVIRQYFYHYEVMNCDVTLDLSRRGEMIIHDAHGEDDWRVTLADTGISALKGARLKRLERHIRGDSFLLTYGDGLANVDIDALTAFHQAHGKIATVTGVSGVSRFGELKTNGDRVASFVEKPAQDSDFINGGYFVMSRRIFDYLSANDDCDLEIGALEQIARDGEMMMHKHQGFWACMDTQRDRDYLNGLWDSGAPPWKVW